MIVFSRLIHRIMIAVHKHTSVIVAHIHRVQLETLALVLLLVFSPWWVIETTLPWQSIWGTKVGWANRYDILRMIDGKQDEQFSVYVNNKEVDKIKPLQVGLAYNTEELFREVYAETSPAQVVKASLNNVEAVPLIIYQDDLDSYVDDLVQQNFQPAENARLTIVNGVAEISEEKSGSKLDRDVVAKSIKEAVSKASSRIDLNTVVESPEVTRESLVAKQAELANISARPALEIKVGSDTFYIEGQVLGSFVDMDKINTPEPVQLSRNKIAEYVSSVIAPKVAKQGTPETVVSIDRSITETRPGTPGSILDESKLVEAIESAFKSGDSSITGETLEASAGVVTDKRYSRSSVGLQYLLSDWQSENSGEWGVSIKDDSDPVLIAYLNPDTKFVTASIYKMYLASFVYTQLDSGATQRSDMTALGKSVESCLAAMIVVSDNSCPSYFFDNYGYKTIQQFVADNGYSDTDVDNSSGGDKWTTARDTMKLMQDIKSGNTISELSIAELTANMGTQIYRNGIPKGIPGKTVQDKVGFLYGYNHDVAYVSGQRPYTLVILTNGTSYRAVAELSKRIDEVMSK